MNRINATLGLVTIALLSLLFSRATYAQESPRQRGR